MADDHESRITALEVEHRHMVEALKTMSAKVDEMHTLLTKARGGWWLMLMLFSAGGFLAGKLGATSSFFGVK
jgi:hypothetical protein